jgi:hypothetical protein
MTTEQEITSLIQTIANAFYLLFVFLLYIILVLAAYIFVFLRFFYILCLCWIFLKQLPTRNRYNKILRFVERCPRLYFKTVKARFPRMYFLNKTGYDYSIPIAMFLLERSNIVFLRLVYYIIGKIILGY